jgi:hypothetical protein
MEEMLIGYGFWASSWEAFTWNIDKKTGSEDEGVWN